MIVHRASGMRALLIAVVLILADMTAGQAQSLQEQAICAAQAAKAYQQDFKNAPSILPGYKLVTSDYQSHYNTRLNKCLILVHQTSEYGGQLADMEQLADAFERRVIADYILNLKGDLPAICQLYPSLDQTTNCASHAEFEAFVAKYMEQ